MRQDPYKKARRRVKFIKAFYIHASVYVIMGTFFFAINATTDPFHLWFFYPLMPWGAAVAMHYLFTFGIPGSNILSREWEEREYQKQLDKYADLYGEETKGYLTEAKYSDEELDLPEMPPIQRRFSSDELV